MVGPDRYRALMSFLLIAVPGAACLGLPAWKLLEEADIPGVFAVGCVLLILTLLLMVAVSVSNPGFIPRQSAYFSTGPIGALPLSSLSIEPSKYLEIPVNGVQIRMKFCKSCSLLRPPRTSHCGTCGVCVERFDHHCPWVGNCIGKKNYGLFLTFLGFIVVNQGFMWGVCLFHILKVKRDIEEWSETIRQEIPELILGSYSLLVIPTQIFLFVCSLSVFHLFLIVRNETTYEHLKRTWKHRGENPFNTGLPENCLESICPLPSPARFDLRAMVEATALTIFRSAKSIYFYETFGKGRSLYSEEVQVKRQGSMNASDIGLFPGANSTRGGSREARV